MTPLSHYCVGVVLTLWSEQKITDLERSMYYDNRKFQQMLDRVASPSIYFVVHSRPNKGHTIHHEY